LKSILELVAHLCPQKVDWSCFREKIVLKLTFSEIGSCFPCHDKTELQLTIWSPC
jgi:hypothetical protein